MQRKWVPTARLSDLDMVSTILLCDAVVRVDCQALYRGVVPASRSAQRPHTHPVHPLPTGILPFSSHPRHTGRQSLSSCIACTAVLPVSKSIIHTRQHSRSSHVRWLFWQVKHALATFFLGLPFLLPPFRFTPASARSADTAATPLIPALRDDLRCAALVAGIEPSRLMGEVELPGEDAAEAELED